jgi:hypothetical protein
MYQATGLLDLVELGVDAGALDRVGHVPQAAAGARGPGWPVRRAGGHVAARAGVVVGSGARVGTTVGLVAADRAPHDDGLAQVDLAVCDEFVVGVLDRGDVRADGAVQVCVAGRLELVRVAGRHRGLPPVQVGRSAQSAWWALTGKTPLGSHRSVSTQMPSSRAAHSTSCTSVGSTWPMAASSNSSSSRWARAGLRYEASAAWTRAHPADRQPAEREPLGHVQPFERRRGSRVP